jgi:hypothetical protein
MLYALHFSQIEPHLSDHLKMTLHLCKTSAVPEEKEKEEDMEFENEEEKPTPFLSRAMQRLIPIIRDLQSEEYVTNLHKRMEEERSRRKILIIGKARHGKDTCAELLKEFVGIQYISSAQFACDEFIYAKLIQKYGYKTKQECFEDRVNHREEWYRLICEFNTPNKANLATSIMYMYNCYVGMRDYEEFIASKHLFKLIIWVDASKRVENVENDVMLIPKNEADIVIENNGTLKEFEEKVKRLAKFI